MARADLLVSLVKASIEGDKEQVRCTAESIIAEERVKQHNVLADRLARALIKNNNRNGNGSRFSFVQPELSSRVKDCIVEIVPNRHIEDIVLSLQTREVCDSIIEEQHRASLLRSHGLEPRHKILLVGPPGNGKTTLAEAIAEKLAVPFFVVRYESVIGSFLGETATRLRRVFDYARTTPCVLFFDEFDAIGKERGDIHETGEIKRVVTSLLMQVDDLPSYTVIIAATNHAELLDRAAWRRFDVRLELPAPTQDDLIKYLTIFLDKFDDPAGHDPKNMVESLGEISYAETEQFCLDVRRRLALSLGELPLKEVISRQLKSWSMRIQKS